MAANEGLDHTRDILNLETLLQPISEENPVGDDIREDPSPTSPYYTIKDARNSARAAERSNMFDGDSSEADEHWRKVENLAPGILKNNAKDLEIASWLTEALIRRKGFTGLRDGFRLIHGLIESYWDVLYPLPDEYGVETRISSLTGLNGEGYDGVLITPIRNAAITDKNAKPGPFSFWQYQQGVENDNIEDKDTQAAKIAKIGFSLEDFDKAVQGSSVDFFVHVRDDIRESISTFRKTGNILDEYCGVENSPPTSNIINILEECLGAVLHTGKGKFPVEIVEAPETLTDNNASDALQTADATPTQTTGPIRSREEAFRKISEIAEFLRKTEPHSPISYILERAVLWGEMSLEELMMELITDNGHREAYGALTGIRTSSDDN
ncbi:Uncharacterized protein ImpA [hydrothermal vent metagenome]|uniref:Uncharacterized protein ImpA n=1 Tax=hydrothermal vent metagenome TaxID=652676 RepID=A0A3B0XQZ4_9ZZZZ